MKFIRKTTEIVIIFLFFTMVVVVFLQVVARYIFNSPPSWSEELARYCQVWIIILASSICIRKGSHLAVDYISHRLTWKINRGIEIFTNVLVVFYVAVVAIFGVRLMLAGQYQVSAAIQIKMSLIYLVFPLGGLLMLIEAVLKTVESVKKIFRKDKDFKTC